MGRKPISDGLKEIRHRLESITENKSVPAEEISTNADVTAYDEADAIGGGRYDDIEKQRKKANVQSIVEHNLDAKDNRKLRWKYAKWVFCYLVSYSIFVAIMLVMSAWKIFGFNLPSTVLEFLVGSTAAAAIGLVYAVTNGLFAKSKV